MATIPNINTFGNNGGGAAFGNPTIARQGQAASAQQVSNAGGGRGFVNPAADPSAPPPKAPAAQIKTNGVTASLVNALNQHQQDLVKATKQELADEYVIEFAPPDLAASQMKKQGQTNAQTAPGLRVWGWAGPLLPAGLDSLWIVSVHAVPFVLRVWNP